MFILNVSDSPLSLEIAGIKMVNPLIAASGCYGYGFDYRDFIDPSEWGAIVVKGTTLHPRQGNPPPRLAETPSGLLNAIGLQNPGIHYFLEHIAPRLPELGCPAIVNISGETVEQYAEIASLLDGAPFVAGVEVNISCPNVRCGGVTFGSDPAVVEKLVSSVRESYHGPLIVKLSLEGGHIAAVAKAARLGGADALSLINTIKGMVIDVSRRTPVLGNITGGLSGPALRPVAVRAVWEICETSDIPVVGMGGITSAEDALQFILAGAAAVAVGTANFVNPLAPRQIAAGLQRYLEENNIKHFSQLIGAARRASKS